MLAVAAGLFATRGYVATSIEEIASAAGVSRATVFSSVGGKPALLKAALDVAIVGDDEPVPLAARERARLIRSEPEVGRYLALYAGLVTEMGERLAPIYEAVRGAAAADADARRLWESHQSQRLQGARHVVSDVVKKGRLRAGLRRGEAADLVWVLNDPGLYHRLVIDRGWRPSRFQSWLAASLQSQLLPDR